MGPLFFAMYVVILGDSAGRPPDATIPEVRPDSILGLEKMRENGVSLGIQLPCQRMIGVYNHLLSKVFRFHYHSKKVIGSLGFVHP